MYDTVDEYVLRNKHNVSDKLDVNEAALSLLDIWITPDDKLMVVCNCENFFDIVKFWNKGLNIDRAIDSLFSWIR